MSWEMYLPALEAFLASAFDDAELRRLVAHLPEDREPPGAAVPGQGRSPAELAYQVVALLRRHGRLDARQPSTATAWAPDELRLPRTGRGEALRDDEQEAKDDAQQRAGAEAVPICDGLRQSPLHRRRGASASDEPWARTQFGRQWRFRLDGQALCQAEIGKSVETETCGTAEVGR